MHRKLGWHLHVDYCLLERTEIKHRREKNASALTFATIQTEEEKLSWNKEERTKREVLGITLLPWQCISFPYFLAMVLSSISFLSGDLALLARILLVVHLYR